MYKKKLWIINHYATPPKYGGLNRHHYFAKFLRDYNIDTTIIAASAIHNSEKNFVDKKSKELYKKHKIEDVEYIHIKTNQYVGNNIGRIINMIQYFFRTLNVIKKLPKPDYIYSSSPNPLSSLIALNISKKIGVQCITEIRDLWPESLISYKVLKSKNIIYHLLYSLEKYIYLKSDKLVFTMANAVEYLKEQNYIKKIDINKIYYLNNGVNLKEFYNNKKEYKTKDSDLDDKKTFKIIYTGSLRYIYDIPKILELAIIAKDKGLKDIKFLIYGTGPYEESLKKYVKENKIDNIIFKGFVDSKYLPYILSKCDLNLLHGKSTSISKYGMSANKTFMYLASGKPIISTYNEKNGIIEKYNCGKIVNSEDENKYIDTILYFYNLDKKEYKKYCNNSLKTAKMFDYEKLVEKLVNILEVK